MAVLMDRFDFHEKSVPDLVALLQETAAQAPESVKATVRVQLAMLYDDIPELRVVRDPTPEEVEAQKRSWELRAAADRKREREEFERLKAKYEPSTLPAPEKE